MTPHRIENDVSNELEQVTLAFDQNSFEPSLKQMADPAMAFIETLGVPLVEPLHTAGQPDLGRLDEQVVVVRHQHPRVQKPAALGDDAREETHEAAAILIVTADVATFVTTAGDVPDGTRKFETKLAGHGIRRRERVKTEEAAPARVWGRANVPRRRVTASIPKEELTADLDLDEPVSLS